MHWLNPKYWLLKHPRLWYIESEWTSQKWLYYHKQRKQLLRHRLYKKHTIISNFHKKPYTVEQAVKLFMHDFRRKKLFNNRTAVIYTVPQKK